MSRAVQLFHTCLVNEIAPEVGMAAARVLERQGLDAGMKAFAWAAARPAAYRALTRIGRMVLRGRARGGWIARAPGLAAGWTRFRDLRAPAKRTFQELWRARAGRTAR